MAVQLHQPPRRKGWNDHSLWRRKSAETWPTGMAYRPRAATNLVADGSCVGDSYKRLQQQHEQALADYRTLKVELDRLNRQSRQSHDEHQHEKSRLLARISQLTHDTRTSDSQSRLQLESTIDGSYTPRWG